jgi:Ion channel
LRRLLGSFHSTDSYGLVLLMIVLTYVLAATMAHRRAGRRHAQPGLVLSFVTLTTTGYGNLVPAGNPGQSLAVLEALMGQLFLVTAVGKLVSAWRPRGWRDPSPGTESPLDRSG